MLFGLGFAKGNPVSEIALPRKEYKWISFIVSNEKRKGRL